MDDLLVFLMAIAFRCLTSFSVLTQVYGLAGLADSILSLSHSTTIQPSNTITVIECPLYLRVPFRFQEERTRTQVYADCVLVR